MLGPALGEYNAASHLVWTVIYVLLVLVAVLFVLDYLRDRYYAFRNRRQGTDRIPVSPEPARGEGLRLEKPDSRLRARDLHWFVPVCRNWFEGRVQDPPRPDRPER